MKDITHKFTGFARGAVEALFPDALNAAVEHAQTGGWRIDTPDRYCPRCGCSVGPGGVTTRGCSRCVGTRPGWDRIVRLHAYDDPINQWIVAMKFARKWTWAPWLGRALASSIGSHHPPARVVVCPVPMHWTRRVHRGYNQARLIATALGHQKKWRVLPLLRRVRYTKPQLCVPPTQRAVNIRRSITGLDLDLKGWEVWVVDDVKTTGSTLSACAGVLRKAGADRVNVAVAAVADPHGTDFQLLPVRPNKPRRKPRHSARRVV